MPDRNNTFKYNTVEFEEPCETLEFNAEPIFNGPDYLYTRYYVHVRGVLNPGSTSYTLTGLGQLSQSDKARPAETHQAIRHVLSQPRGQLVYYPAGKEDALISPDSQFPVDAANGPFPRVFNVTEVAGDGTWIVEMAVETFVNESDQFTDHPPILLSHRWTMSDDLDDDFFLTRTIQGLAIFRADLLDDNLADPDDFRAWLLHPVPQGFKRESIRVNATPDGSELEYVVVDRQKASNLIARGVTRVEALWTYGVTSPGLEEAAWQTGRSALDFAQTGAGVAANAADGNITSWSGVVGATNSLVNSGVALAETVRSNVPRLTNSIAIRVWGNPKSRRADLCKVALAVAKARLSLFEGIMGCSRIFITQDLGGRFIELTASVISGPCATTIRVAVGAGQLLLPDIFGPSALVDDSVAGVFQVGTGTNPEPNGGRGTYMARLAAASLGDEDETPDKPTEPTTSKDYIP